MDPQKKPVPLRPLVRKRRKPRKPANRIIRYASWQGFCSVFEFMLKIKKKIRKKTTNQKLLLSLHDKMTI
jgi:hypothetical protein